MNRPPQDADNSADPNDDSDAAEITRAFQDLLKSWTEAKSVGQDDEAMAKALEAFQFAVHQAEQNPTPDLLLMEEADRLECSGDWAGAERARREVLRLKEAEGNAGMIAKAHHDLSRFFLLRGRLDEAWESALAATGAARRYEIRMVLAMMLENEGWCAWVRGDPDRAHLAAEEGLGALELLATEQGWGALDASRLTEGIRGRLWMLKARAFVAKGLWKETEHALAQARQLVGHGKPVSFVPGPIVGEAAGWEVEAALRVGLGDGAGAVEAWQKAVEKRRQVLTFPHLKGPYSMSALARALEGLGQSLAEQGLAEEAVSIRDEAASLRRLLGEGNSPPNAAAK